MKHLIVHVMKDGKEVTVKHKRITVNMIHVRIKVFVDHYLKIIHVNVWVIIIILVVIVKIVVQELKYIKLFQNHLHLLQSLL